MPRGGVLDITATIGDRSVSRAEVLECPVQWTSFGRARLDGPPSGALRHQFRDEPGDGFTARLTIEFPRVTPARLVDAHRWHLACEFSNWIEAANA